MNDKDFKLLSPEEIKAIQIEMLSDFYEFCNKNNLKFYLCGGTLLGAVRHGGFIPWDDDIDLMMSRDDYNKLVYLAKNENKAIKDNIAISSYEIDNSVYPFIKLYRTDTYTDCSDTPEHRGIWIDVFPYDKLPKSDDIFAKCVNYKRFLIYKNITKSNGKKFKFLFKKIISSFLPPKRFFAKKLVTLSQKYQHLDTCEVGVCCWGYGKQERLNISDIVGDKMLLFEGMLLPVLNNYDKYLKQLYGDYMQLPPIEKRITHGFKAWLKINNNQEEC